MRPHHVVFYNVVFTAQLAATCFAAHLHEQPRPSVPKLTENNASTERSSYKGAWTPGTVIESQADVFHCIDSKRPCYDLVSDQQPFTFGKMGSAARDANFKKVQQFKADYAEAEFTQYESQRTGMNVVVVDRKGPKIYGYFALATEIHDDSGARE